MPTYNISITPVSVAGKPAHLVRVGFGDPADNSTIVRDVESRLVELKADGVGGRLALINGPASLPVAVVLSHHLLHLYSFLGVFDPKLQGYVISSAHGGDYAVGDLIPASEVQDLAPA